jgi:hypothetical protein
VRHRDSCSTGRSDGQDVHDPESRGEVQVPQDGEQGRQVPLVATERYGQVGIQTPSEAKVLSGHRVQVVAEVTQEMHELSHPTLQHGPPVRLRTYVGMSHSFALIQVVGRTPRSMSLHTSPIRADTHHGIPHKSTYRTWQIA